MAHENKVMKRRNDEIFSFSYDKKFFKNFFFEKFKNYKFNEFSFFFPFLGSTFWNNISDFFVFKSNNKFDLFSFFENKSFDFIIFSHFFNGLFFSKILTACSKQKGFDFLFTPLLNHYDFIVRGADPYRESLAFFERELFFKEIPTVYQNTEKDIIFFFEFF